MDANGFERLIDHLRTVTPRAELTLTEVPAPQKLATFAFAFSADVSNGLVGEQEDEVANGRFVLLHEPGGQPIEKSTHRPLQEQDTAGALQAHQCRVAGCAGSLNLHERPVAD